MGRSISEAGRAGRASDGGWVADIGDEGFAEVDGVEGEGGVVVIFFEGPQEMSPRVSSSASARMTGAEERPLTNWGEKGMNWRDKEMEDRG
jgi:hypothetical protein